MAHFVEEDHIYFDDESNTCDEALKFLANKACELGVVESAESAYEAFAAREAQDSTGMEAGIAIPHAMSENILKPAVIIAKYTDGMDWSSMDNSEIKLAIALLIPKDQEGIKHLKNLSKIASLILKKDICTELVEANDAQTLADIINSNI